MSNYTNRVLQLYKRYTIIVSSGCFGKTQFERMYMHLSITQFLSTGSGPISSVECNSLALCQSFALQRLLGYCFPSF